MNETSDNSNAAGLFVAVIIVILAAAVAGGWYAWSSIDDLRLEARSLTRRIASLTRENKELSEKASDLEREGDDLRRDKRNCGAALSKAERNADSLERKIARLEADAKTRPQTVGGGEKAAAKDGADKEKAALAAGIETLERRAAEGKSRAPASPGDAGDAGKDAAASLREERDDLQAKADEAEKRAQACEAALDKERGQSAAERGELETAYKGMVANLKDELKNKEVVIRRFAKSLELDMVDTVLFRFGSSQLSAKGRKVLSAIADQLENTGGRRIFVVGHTDDIPVRWNAAGPYKNNWQLSADRAAAVVEFLSGRSKIAPERFAIVGRSSYDPVADNASPQGRAKNRRVEIIIGGLDIKGAR